MRRIMAALALGLVLLWGHAAVAGVVLAGGEVAPAHGDAHGAAGAHQTHVNWYKFGPEPGENQPFLATALNFIVLLLLLGRFALPPIRAYVKERHESIRNDLDEAQRLRDEAASRLKEYEEKLAGIDTSIAELLQGIRGEAEAERDRIIKAAESEAQRLRLDAQTTMTQDLKRFRHEIEQEAVTAALAAAEKIIKERMTPTDQRTLMEQCLAGLTDEGAPQPRGVA